MCVYVEPEPPYLIGGEGKGSLEGKVGTQVTILPCITSNFNVSLRLFKRVPPAVSSLLHFLIESTSTLHRFSTHFLFPSFLLFNLNGSSDKRLSCIQYFFSNQTTWMEYSNGVGVEYDPLQGFIIPSANPNDVEVEYKCSAGRENDSDALLIHLPTPSAFRTYSILLTYIISTIPIPQS